MHLRITFGDDDIPEIVIPIIIADVSLSIIEDGRLSAIRCGSGVVFSYTTRSGLDILFQIGTGPWDE